MPEDQLTDANLSQEPSETVDWAEYAKNLEAKITALETSQQTQTASYKAMQRNLEAANRRASEANARFQESLNTFVETSGIEDPDERMQTLRAQMAASQTQAQQSQSLSQLESKILADLEAAGVTSNQDPRWQEISRNWQEGDYMTARAQALIYKQEAAKATADPPHAQEDIQARIDAAVEARLRAAGIREVDSGTNAANSAARFSRENLKETLSKMSRAEILANLSEITKNG